MMNTYQLYFTNFGYFDAHRFDRLEDAVARARAVCFECSIWFEGKVVAFFRPLSGVEYC
jgi:hypothetical protein